MSKTRLISAEDTLAIRQVVLWPDMPIEHVQLAEDPDGIHLGLFVASGSDHTEKLVGVASFFPQGKTARLRKMAILPEMQGQGWGSRLLREAIEHLAARGISAVWCDVRRSAAGFYQTLDFGISRDVFIKNGIEYLKAQKSLI